MGDSTSTAYAYIDRHFDLSATAIDLIQELKITHKKCSLVLDFDGHGVKRIRQTNDIYRQTNDIY